MEVELLGQEAQLEMVLQMVVILELAVNQDLGKHQVPGIFPAEQQQIMHSCQIFPYYYFMKLEIK
jgi:hypothetical protein